MAKAWVPKNLIVILDVLLFPRDPHLRTHRYKSLIAHCPASLTFIVSVHIYLKFIYATLKGPRASLLKTGDAQESSWFCHSQLRKLERWIRGGEERHKKIGSGILRL